MLQEPLKTEELPVSDVVVHGSKAKPKIFNITKMTKEHCLKNEFLQSLIINEGNYDKSDFNFDGLINALVNIKQTDSVSAFHVNFLEFKKVLNFKRSQRKTKIDSILKKCKSKFFRAVQEAIKKITIDSSQIGRLPQSFITNINIDFNKEYMNKTLFQIYAELGIINPQNVFSGMEQEKIYLLKNLFDMTYSQLFTCYISSQRFKSDCRSIGEKEGEKFEILYKCFKNLYTLLLSQQRKQTKKNKRMILILLHYGVL